MFVHIMVFFCGLFIYFGSVYIMWDEHGSHFSFCTFCVLQFWAFLGDLAVFAHSLGFIGNLGVLRAIVSYKVTRWIPLIVGRVTKGLPKGTLPTPLPTPPGGGGASKDHG